MRPSTSDSAHLYVALERDESGYPPYDTEEIDATRVRGDEYRITGIPDFVYGLSRDDVVRVQRVRGDDKLWISEVLEPGDHWTSRLVPADVESLEDVAKEFREMNCDARATSFGLVVVDVPAAASEANVISKIENGHARGLWEYDYGVSPPSRR